MTATSSQPSSTREPSSFRDPSGFIFYGPDGSIYRQVNDFYRVAYETLIRSGLYDRLIKAQLLIAHQETDAPPQEADGVYRVLQVERLPFISYSYEWCFSQLKDAALLTLQIQKLALAHGMILKDASAYNVQFRAGRPIWIDTLSFDIYKEGEPWVAYRQFCQHFLVPLALMSKTDIRLRHLLRTHLDGIAPEFAVNLLPGKVFLRPGLFFHLYLHAKSQRRASSRPAAKGSSLRCMRKDALHLLLKSLESTIQSLKWEPAGTEWIDYYRDDSYTKVALADKVKIVERHLDVVKPANVWDFGANTGLYSALASTRGIPTLSMDNDEGAVERQYVKLKKHPDSKRLPLLIDIINPSPSCGWDIQERMSLFERGPADMVFALALVHHLAIGNNVPFSRIAQMLRRVCRYLVIEFVPKADKKVQTMLALRKDVFSYYTREVFEQEFQKFFIVRDSVAIKDSLRTMYLMENTRPA